MEIEQVSKPKRKPHEWNAQAYADGNKMQQAANKHFIAINGINTKNLKIFEIGCGTGEQAEMLSHEAQHVHAIDASKNMINFAQNKYGHLKKVSFEQCFAEDFESDELFQLALASCSFHWFQDRKQALKQINKSLEVNGEFFANIQTANHPEPFTLVVFREMLAEIPLLGTWLAGCANPTGQSPLPTNEELDIMLKETGFEIIKHESQNFSWTDTKPELKKWIYPIIMSRPAVKYIPEGMREWAFDNFFERCLTKLINNNDETYTFIHITEIVHARKVKNNNPTG